MSEEPTPEFYRAEAERVLALAQKTHLPVVKERLLRVALSYEDLARQAEALTPSSD